MLRRISILLWLGATAAFAAIWPDQFAGEARKAVLPVPITDRAIWEEYGLDASEGADFGKFTALAYRLRDSTGALAAFEWQRPKNAAPSKTGKLAVETPDELLVAYGNYLLWFKRYKPQVADLEQLIHHLPKLENSPLPVLAGYLPAGGLVPNSERYLTGPASLEKFFPGLRPSAAAFHLGAEAQTGQYQTARGLMSLAVFSYPTPHLARERLQDFQKVPGAMAKRSGPLLAVVLTPADPDAAEKLLAAIRYQVDITLSQYVPTRRDNIANLVLNAFVLIGILLAFCLAAGLAFGGMRHLRRRLRGAGAEDEEAMILLHLGDR